MKKEIDKPLPSNIEEDVFKLRLEPIGKSLGKITTSVTIDKTVVVGTGLTRITIPNAGKEVNWSEFQIQPRGHLNEPVDNYSESDFQAMDIISLFKLSHISIQNHYPL